MIKSVEEYVKRVRDDASRWHPEEPKWFRGEPKSKTTALLPTLYREGFAPRENALLQMFRARAPGFHNATPDRFNTDQWLFLARHVGLPTRLLDWTESALLGLHFAVKEKSPVVWMLNPLDLNDLSYTVKPSIENREFPLPWFEPKDGRINPAFENIGGAWGENKRGVRLPVAVYPTYVHARLRAQRSCFTVQGARKQGLNLLIPDTMLKRYEIDSSCRKSISKDLVLLGVTDSVAFPDLNGLAEELKNRFRKR
jgi:FRG domain